MRTRNTPRNPVPIGGSTLTQVAREPGPRKRRPIPSKTKVTGWLSEQFEPNRILNAIIMLGIFGFIPGAWMIGLPVLTLYGISKQRSLRDAIQRLNAGLGNWYNETADTFGRRVGDLFSNHPGRFLKLIIALGIFLFSGVNFFTIISFYGIYSYTADEWAAIFKEKLGSTFRFFSSIISTLRNSPEYNMRYGFSAFILLTSIFTAAMVGIIATPGHIAEMLCMWVGLNAILRDLKNACLSPIKSLAGNLGKILGARAGFKIAFALFKGKIHGSLGNPVGYLKPDGIFGVLFPSAGFATKPGLYNKVAHYVNSLFSSVFITQEVHLHGDFWGTVGPSPIQLFACLFAGVLVGYALERAVHHIIQSMKADGVHLAKKGILGEQTPARRMRGENQLAQRNVQPNPPAAPVLTHFRIAMITMATPLILSTKLGVGIIALCGASPFIAAIAVSTALTVMFRAVHGIHNTLVHRQAAPPRAPGQRRNRGAVAPHAPARHYTPALNARNRAQRPNRELRALGVPQNPPRRRPRRAR